MNGTKVCPDCKKELSLDMFYKRGGKRKGQPISKCIKCHKAYYNKRTLERKKAIVTLYGGRCECCGETAIEFLSIDHINGNGHEERKEKFGRDFYIMLLESGKKREDLRLLCMNCNFSLGKYGYCPHEK